MRPTFVSIVIPTLNSAYTIDSCLGSIKSNRTRHQYEIIVVDGGSEDATAEIARRYTEQVFSEDTYFRGTNRNKGIQQAQGDIICFTDSDCVVPKNWIDQLVQSLLSLNRKDNKVVGVGGGNVAWLEHPSIMERAISSAIRSPLVAFGARNVSVYKKEVQVYHNPPMNSAYFRRALIEVEGFGEDYNVGEDVELDLKLGEKGYKLYYLPSVIVKHKHRSSIGKFAAQMYSFGKSRIRLGRKFKQFAHHSRFGNVYHYGPTVLCLMTFSPLFFVPWGMGLLNGAYVSLRERNILLFFPVALLTVTFYVSYGLGEISYMCDKT